MPVAGTYSIVNYVREGLRGPFKAKNFLPAAGTYDIVNYFKRGPFQAKKFLPVAGTILIVNWKRCVSL